MYNLISLNSKKDTENIFLALNSTLLIVFEHHIREHVCSRLLFMQCLQLLLGWLYMDVTKSVAHPCCGRLEHACKGDRERRVLLGNPEEEIMPMRTYYVCVLQTFHRMCKTSESVRPLDMREGGREGGMKGTGKLTGQLSEVTAVYLASPQRHLHPSLHVSRRSFSHSIANIITHDVNMLKKSWD